MLEVMEQLYAAELALCELWFDFFRRFPMVEDSEFYFEEATFYANAARETFKGMGEMAEMFNEIEKHLGKEGLQELQHFIEAGRQPN